MPVGSFEKVMFTASNPFWCPHSPLLRTYLVEESTFKSKINGTDLVDDVLKL